MVHCHPHISTMATAKESHPGIFEFMDRINTTDKCIQYLRDLGILPSCMKCVKCDIPMILGKVKSKVTSDQERFQCTKCKSTSSIRKGTFMQVTQHVKYLCNVIFNYLLSASSMINFQLLIMWKIQKCIKRNLKYIQSIRPFCRWQRIDI